MFRRIAKIWNPGERPGPSPSAGPLALGILLAAWSSLLPGRLSERSRRRARAAAADEAEAEADPRPRGPADSSGVGEAAERLLTEIAALAGVDAALLALTDEDGRHARGFAARGVDAAWWRGVSIDLEHDASAIASAARERTAFAIFDVVSAPNVSRRLADAVGAKSAAFVPALVDGRVVGVVVAAAREDRRFFTAQELAQFQVVANRAAPILERSRSADAMRRSLEREKLVGELARKVRDRLDLDDVLRVAVNETGRVLGADRCLVRLGDAGEPMRIAAEWRAPNLEPADDSPDRMAVSNLALRERRTVALDDIGTAPELDEPALGGREGVLSLGSRAVLATPIVVFDHVIGTLAVHRTHPTAWSSHEGTVIEAVAGEIGLAVYAARLLDEDARRLDQQGALLNAAQVVTSDLRFESVLERLVGEVARLFGADAADCWMFEAGSGLLRCRAVYGLPEEEEIGRRIPPSGTFADAIARGEPVLRTDFARTEDPPPSKNFAGFEEVMVAPMTWLGEVRGVLGVCSRESERFNASELELLDAFARFASLASHNAESFEERERQAQIQQGFYRVAEVLGSPLSLEETLDALAQAAAEALGGESAAVLTADGSLRLAGSYELAPGLADALARGLEPDATPFPAAAAEERIVSSTGLADDDRFDPAVRALLAEHGYAALLAAPVERTTGERDTALVLFREETTFSDDDLALARHLSRAARGALERSELFEAERRARDLAQRLATVGSGLVTNLDPSVVLDEVVREAPGLVSADAAVIRMIEGDELVVRAAHGPGTGAASSGRTSSGSGYLGEAIQSRRPATVDDARSAPRAGRGDPLLGESLVACVAVPMAAHSGRLLGVLSVYAAAPRAWREDETQALLALAAMASAAIANAELYQGVAEEKERSEAILGNIADGIVATDREGRIVLWNSMAEQVTGVPAAEALGRRVVETLQRELATEEGEGDPVGEREVAIVRGGKDVWLSLTEAVMRDASGAVLGRIFAFRDVSSERAVEQLKSDFVATVSHELRTPLTSIYGFAETLLRQDVAFGEAERETFLGYIASESERLIGIVDDLLNVARLEAGMLGIATGPTDVGAILTETVSGFETDANGHRFVLDLPEGPLDAEADETRLRDVLRHLVDNAVKFSPEGGTITVTARRRADSIEVRVLDEGLGIAHGDRQRIFTKFVRGEAGPLAATQGTGVGLFLARGLLTAMHGRIWVESEEGAGSCFVFELPVSNVSAPGRTEGA